MSEQQLPWPPETGVWKTYPMHCHCGTIRWNITISPPLFPSDDPENKGTYAAVDCHCSYCQRNGILPIHPKSANVVFTQGLEERKEYLTASKKCPQWFCGQCGSCIGTDLSVLAKEMGMEGRYSINLRMLKDFDVSKIEVKKVGGMDMKDAPPKYPPFEV
ncbi:uncharacterized protein RCC_07867 [Ramularia collo-cygni]|uniref:CENP-V/GFA domain-containing protein n=1 Tax=Ramularia collo-cygni TaxID=112498 RepID=A0A2D3V2F0_9PEZI|nr:uncharacterized protein RCC_07867 [Ramularia collo-cygni]CZT21998.1 uncharacterized protein RCC_07867 [Ramularia collo-cygni]